METTNTAPRVVTPSRGRVITGIVISWVCILFLLFDAIMKIIRERHVIETSQHIGWPLETLQPIGVVLLICTVLYMFRRTSVLGAILLTAWLGGGTAINIRSGFPWFFTVIFGLLVWLGLWLRDGQLAKLLPLKKD